MPWAECDLADTRAAEDGDRGGSPSRPAASTAWSPRPASTCPGGWPTCRRDDWERVVTVDLLATAAVVRAALPYLNARTARVVTVASTLGVKAVSDATAYCAAKFGVVGFTRALAAELAGAVGVTLLIPGGMRTAFFDDRDRAVPAAAGRRAQRPGQRGRRGAVRAEPAARLRRARAGRLRRAGSLRTRDAVILALRALGVGDLATAVPALRGLRAAFPAHETRARRAALAGPAGRPASARVDRLLPMPTAVRVPPRSPAWSRPPRRWRSTCTAAARSRWPRCAAGRAAGARGRARASRTARRGATTSTRWPGGAGCCPGTGARPTRPTCCPGAGAVRAVAAVVHPGADAASGGGRRERFAAVARALAGRGPVVVTGAGAERGSGRAGRRPGRPAAPVGAGRRTDVGRAGRLVSARPARGHAATPAWRTWPPPTARRRSSCSAAAAVAVGTAGRRPGTSRCGTPRSRGRREPSERRKARSILGLRRSRWTKCWRRFGRGRVGAPGRAIAPVTVVPSGPVAIVRSSVTWFVIHRPRPPGTVGAGAWPAAGRPKPGTGVADPEPQPSVGHPDLAAARARRRAVPRS